MVVTVKQQTDSNVSEFFSPSTNKPHSFIMPIVRHKATHSRKLA